MSVKHVKEHYLKVVKQYIDMQQELREFDEEAAKGLFDPDRLDSIKELLAPLKENYERWSYMMFMLNQPERKKKVTKYTRQHKKLLQSLNEVNSPNNILESNEQQLKKLHEV